MFARLKAELAITRVSPWSRPHLRDYVRDGLVECLGNDEHGQATPPEGEFISVSAAEWPHLRVAARRRRGVLGGGLRIL